MGEWGPFKVQQMCSTLLRLGRRRQVIPLRRARDGIRCNANYPWLRSVLHILRNKTLKRGTVPVSLSRTTGLTLVRRVRMRKTYLDRCRAGSDGGSSARFTSERWHQNHLCIWSTGVEDRQNTAPQVRQSWYPTGVQLHSLSLKSGKQLTLPTFGEVPSLRASSGMYAALLSVRSPVPESNERAEEDAALKAGLRCILHIHLIKMLRDDAC